jgi:ribosomal protein S27AE
MEEGQLSKDGESPEEQVETPAAEEPSQYCPSCSAPLEPHKCKLVCRRCGYFMSCSDYY